MLGGRCQLLDYAVKTDQIAKGPERQAEKLGSSSRAGLSQLLHEPADLVSESGLQVRFLAAAR